MQSRKQVYLCYHVAAQNMADTLLLGHSRHANRKPPAITETWQVRSQAHAHTLHDLDTADMQTGIPMQACGSAGTWYM